MITKTSYGPRPRRNFWGEEKDIYVGTIYISPTGDKETLSKSLKTWVKKLNFSKKREVSFYKGTLMPILKIKMI